MEDWQGQQVDRYYPSHKDLDDLIYFHCLCQFCNIVPSPSIGASLTSKKSFFDNIPRQVKKYFRQERYILGCVTEEKCISIIVDK